MVGGPSRNGIEHYALVGKGTVGIVSGGVANLMGVSGGIGKVVFSFVFVHPCCLKETTIVIALKQRFAVFIQNNQIFWLFSKFQHVVAHSYYFCTKRFFLVSGQYRSEEHTSELQSRPHLVCRLLLEKKKKTTK